MEYFQSASSITSQAKVCRLPGSYYPPREIILVMLTCSLNARCYELINQLTMSLQQYHLYSAIHGSNESAKSDVF